MNEQFYEHHEASGGFQMGLDSTDPAAVGVAAEHSSSELTMRTTDGAELSVIGALNVVLQRRGLIILFAMVTFLIVETGLFVQQRKYAATSSFIPQSKRSVPSISGIAAQFGLSVPGAEAGQSPAFYADLIVTREILGAVVDSRFLDRTLGRDSIALIDAWGGSRARPMQREAAIQRLRKAVRPDVSLKTGVVELTIVTPNPELSAQINQRILALVNQFNLEKRQSQAGMERRFIERRVAEARSELRATEDQLQFFLQRNATWGSPELRLAHDRLEREVTMRQQLYSSLAQAFDQAKIDEIRDNPMITIIEQPQTPLIPLGKGYITNGFLALIGGMLIGLFVVFLRFAILQGRIGSPTEISRFRLLMRAAIRPWTRLPH